MAEALSTIVFGAFCLAVSYAVAYCFPSKEMLDAEAVERERTPPDGAQYTSAVTGSGADAGGDATR